MDTGSGFVIIANGLILTVNHVVQDVSSVVVELPGRGTFTGTVIGRHLAVAVALVSVPVQGLPTLPLGDSQSVEVGETVIKLGYALGLTGEPSATTGIVSAFRQDKRFSSWMPGEPCVAVTP
ncbi:MAG: hypothetical protein EXR55_02945 [Dehalococcoidia bacterium]|nr:hypothetical protein [Dehalococcoidia bacterium]